MKILSLLAACLLWPSLAFSQPVVAVVTPFTGTGASGCSGSVDASGTNALLVASVATSAGGSFPTVTSAVYDSAALSFIVAQNISDGVRVEQWLRQAPSTGSNTFSASFNVTVGSFNCIVHVLTNAHQTAAVGNSGTGIDPLSSTSSVVVSSAATEMVIDVVVGEGIGWDCTAGAGQTEDFDSDANGQLVCSSHETGSGTTTMTQTLNNGPGSWAAVATGFKQAAGAAAVTRHRAAVVIQ